MIEKIYVNFCSDHFLDDGCRDNLRERREGEKVGSRGGREKLPCERVRNVHDTSHGGVNPIDPKIKFKFSFVTPNHCLQK